MSEIEKTTSNAEGVEPHGILKNAPQDAKYKKEPTSELEETEAEFDRRKVIENTRLNSRLMGLDSKQGELIRQRIAKTKIRDKSSADAAFADLDDDHLKWDEKNIILNEQEKSATMKIDEPKTPYEGGFDPNNEYYQPDEDLEDIDLGEGADDLDAPADSVEVIKAEGAQLKEAELARAAADTAQLRTQAGTEEPEPDHELTPAEKHAMFEAKRKAHYHMKAEVLHHPLPADDDE